MNWKDLKEVYSKHKQILQSMKKTPKEEDYSIIVSHLNEPWPRTVQLEALKALLENPHPNAPVRLMELMIEKEHTLGLDIPEYTAKSKGPVAEKLAESYDLLPIHARRSLAYFLNMHANSENPLMKKALKDKNRDVVKRAKGKLFEKIAKRKGPKK